MVDYHLDIIKVNIVVERMFRWQSVRHVEKQLHLVIIEVSQCERQIENLNQIFKKSQFLRMGKK